MDLGKAIYTVRKKKNLSQNKFSELLDIDQSYLSLIENNKKKPSIKLLEKVSSNTDLPLPILLFFSLSEEDVKDEKKELFNMMFPKIKEMVSVIFDEEDYG
ncbi:MAG TPA: helix-turn-helix transcriptional regulator [Sphingobacterium sp.]|nr:helix-turn-helix transcriptional regulator [Sphingobacterium sp.]